MGLEIERKFLVADADYAAISRGCRHIEQFYLSADPERTVRVRIADSRAWVTIKGLTQGCTRHEWEYEIPVADACGMRPLAEGRVVRKTRYLVDALSADGAELTWEVDIFEGALAGLRVAEVELPDAATGVVLPDFIVREVTGLPEYYNSELALAPSLPALQ